MAGVWKPYSKLCGAKTRKGTPCKRMALKNGRCRNHGGLCTGPRTAEGKRRALANLVQYRKANHSDQTPV